MNSDDLVLGIDGGGTKTVAWLAHRSTPGPPAILGRGTAGPSNPQAVGFDEALRNLDQAIATALDDAKTPCVPVAAAVLGLAGSDRDENRRVLSRWAERRRLAGSFRVVHDGLTTLCAGAPDGWGVALISGTGSFAFGQDRHGRTARAGGWGYLLGDEGSAYAIARCGLRAATRAFDGRGPATQVLDRLLAHLHLDAPPQLVSAVYALASDPAAVAALAPLVIEAAAAGDSAALEILHGAADDLADLVAAVVAKLGWADPRFPLCLSGGLLLGAADIQQNLTATLIERGFPPDPVVEVRESVAGAVRLAQADAALSQQAPADGGA